MAVHNGRERPRQTRPFSAQRARRSAGLSWGWWRRPSVVCDCGAGARSPRIGSCRVAPEVTAAIAAWHPQRGVTTAFNQRTHDVYRVLVSAAGSDLAAAELLDEVQQQRSRGQSQITHALDRSGSLRDGLPEHDAVDLVHALMSPEVYRLLVVDRSWPPEKYRRWLAATLIQQLT